MRQKLYIIIFLFILAIGFFLRFYKLGEVPFGFYQDESAIGYNAYSLLTTGKDEHGVVFPLYFKSFGDYKLPVYIYTVIPAIMLFGVTEFAVRFPSAFFGFLTLPLMYFLVFKLTRNKLLALIAFVLLTINPWHLHYNRAAFEVSIALFFFMLGTLLLLLSFEKKIRGGLFLGTLCFIISLYSYNLTRLLAPVLYMLCFVFLVRNKHIDKKEVFFTGIISFILLIPFFQTFLSKGGISSAGGTLMFSSAVVKASLIEMRNYLVDAPWILKSFLFSPAVLLIWQYIQNIAAYLSVPFFFISGSSHGNHGIGNMGQFYLFELPLMIMGFIAALKEKKYWLKFVASFAIATLLVASFTRDIPQATRSFFLLFPLELISAYGLIAVSRIRLTAFLAITVFIFYNILFYFTSYYLRFPTLYAKQWRQQDKLLSLYLNEHAKDYEKIIIDNGSGFIYSSLLFFTAYSPAKFQKEAVWEKADSEGMSKPVSFGKYLFKDIDWTKDMKPRNLLVVSPNKRPVDILRKTYFSYPQRPVVVAVKQEISSYIFVEDAYEIIEGQ